MKPHFPILDGLRGTAAILVVIFHLYEAKYIDYSIHPIHHGYLAVDFFFLLSGFVVGYAYDDRWAKMNVIDFFKIRLVRLHPLVTLGVILGGIGFWLDPYTNGFHNWGWLKLSGLVLLGFTLIPGPDVRGWGETHSLNGPCWSLLQEYLANIIYALVGRKMNKTALSILVTISGIALAVVAIYRNDIATGWSFETFWTGVTRMMFPFFAGLLLFRSGKLIKLKHAYILCSVALIVLLCLPHPKYNGLYEAACIILAFPLIVAAGAGGEVKGWLAKVCKFSGDLSYPIYILHYPFMYVYIGWFYKEKPADNMMFYVGAALFIFCIVLAYAALKLYDEPIRNWLKQKLSKNKEVEQVIG
ncbi:acyltransferase [Solitalea sp. MAHUQ-68]|uniref:Acyltransferase n=1 Tax=Solitalea agri TaxID=2953739 RepID=A0A9X2F3W9_9SPHI|nr:acyltransferase [Solitalea agri]